jgi:hypothetical protein
LSNTPSFDTPNNNVSFVDSNSLPDLLNPPFGHLGLIQHMLGSPRLIRMALHVTF